MTTDLETEVHKVKEWHSNYLELRLKHFELVYVRAASNAVDWAQNRTIIDLYTQYERLKRKIEPERKKFFAELLPALIFNIALGPLSGFVAEVALKKWALRTRAFAVAEKQFWDGVYRHEMREIRSSLNLMDTYPDNLVLKFIGSDSTNTFRNLINTQNTIIERSKLLEASAGFVNDSVALAAPTLHSFTANCVEKTKRQPPNTLADIVGKGLDSVSFLKDSCQSSEKQLVESGATDILMMDDRLGKLRNSEIEYKDKKLILISLGEYYKNKYKYLAEHQQLDARSGDSDFIMKCICAILLFGSPDGWISWMDDDGKNLIVAEKSRGTVGPYDYEFVYSIINHVPELMKALGEIGDRSSFFGGRTLGQHFEREILYETRRANFSEDPLLGYSSDLGINSQRGYSYPFHQPVPLRVSTVPREPIGKYPGSRDYTLEQKISFRIYKFMCNMKLNLYRGLESVELLVHDASESIKRNRK